MALTTHTGGLPQHLPGFGKGTLDRGAGVNKEKRDKLKERSLVDTGKYVTSALHCTQTMCAYRHAGRSRVKVQGVSKTRLLTHYLRKGVLTKTHTHTHTHNRTCNTAHTDFFISVIEIPLGTLIAIFCLLYLSLFFFWALVWYIQWRCVP